MNARSMSGINDSTSSGGGGTGDALLAGGTEASPQTFTGFNRFEELVNFRAVRPSLITTASTSNPTDDEFITKLDGEDLFGSLSGSAQLNGGGNTAEDPPQIFTGFNEFDENVVLGGQYLTFKNGTRRVIDMSENPDQPTNTNKILMTAPKNEIILIGTGSVNQLSMTAQNSAINSFLQTGTVNTVNLISQVGANSTITTDGKFTTATAPTSGTHLCNKTYVDTKEDKIIRHFTFVREILSFNTNTTGYSYIDDMEVVITPTYANSVFKITMNTQYSSLSQDRMIYVAVRLYRNFAHLTAASSNYATTQANQASWVTHNARVNFTSTIHNNQISGMFLDTNPPRHTDGKIYYSIGIRPVASNTGSGGANSNQFKINSQFGDSSNNRPKNTSQMLVEEIKL